MAKELLRAKHRLQRLREGYWQFGCAGLHIGTGTADCPYEQHHHHDEFCEYPTKEELRHAGIDPKVFRARSRHR